MEQLVVKLLVLSLAAFILLAGFSILMGVYYASVRQDKCGLLVDKIREQDQLEAFKFCVDSTRIWK